MESLTPSTVFEHTYQGHTVRAVECDGEVWLCGLDLAPLTGMSRRALRDAIAALEPKYVRGGSIATNKGSRNALFVNESGACQVIIQSRKPEAAQLRACICDLFIAVRRGRVQLVSASGAPLAFDVQQLAQLVAQVVAEVVTQAIRPLTEAVQALAAQHAPGYPTTAWVGQPARQLPLSDLPAWGSAEHNRMRAMDYCLSSEFLAREHSTKPTLFASSRLSRCAGNYCRAHNLSVYRFREGRTGQRIYFPRTALALVHRTGWTKRTAAMAESQGELFQSGELKPPTGE